ncbi:NAD(P)-dependent oxidoreductase [Sedimentibacter saalensis]|uniref:NAD(P)-dependent oxidoreductase n=1 Tax=Sedimentibacter saalensis TaxID=130788 RepID=UPI00289CC373|nr:NAD(P)-dependent oxidoreductase [Sedimentibacter saalensis]
MITSLVGYTGFVGSNIASNNNFTNLYNSKNIEESFGTNPDLLVYAGVRAEKYLANQNAQGDFEIVKNAFDNIKKINPKQIVLISSIDVYKNPIDVDEDSKIEVDGLHPYGLNRYYLEQWIENEFNNSLIIRLPGLFGKNIKKNFIYDMIYVIPKMLNRDKFEEIRSVYPKIENYYIHENNGFYKCKDLTTQERDSLREIFNNIGFSALNFTDSRGVFQFYNLSRLWTHIQIALENGLHKLNLATEPVSIHEVYEYIKKENFKNEISTTIPYYNYKTKYAELFQGKNGYICNRVEVLKDIKSFVEGYNI